MAIRFGGEPEKVRGLADAIYGGGTVEVEPDLKLDTPLKQYQRQFSHDGIYAEATLFLRDREPETAEQEKAPQKQTRLEGPPRKCYIICPQGDMDRLFAEIDRRTGVPKVGAGGGGNGPRCLYRYRHQHPESEKALPGLREGRPHRLRHPLQGTGQGRIYAGPRCPVERQEKGFSLSSLSPACYGGDQRGKEPL